MPALLPVAGVCRITFRGTSAGQAVVNVFHVRCGNDAIAQSNVETILTNVRTFYQSRFVPRLNGSWSGDIATAVDLSTITGVTVEEPLGGIPGANSPTSPNSLACCVTWKINRHYRGGHPRSYIGPIHTSQMENQTTFTSTFLGQMVVAAEGFLSDVNGITTPDGPVSLCSVHRWYNKQELQPPQTSTIVAVGVDSRVDTMRRRLGPDR